MNDIFTKNISSLKRHTSLAGKLSAVLPETIEVRETASGDLTVKVRDFLIHSAYDPVKEAEKFAEKIRPGKLVCLYGYGLGYHLITILERLGPDGFLLVIELNRDLLAAAMILRDQTAILDRKNFLLISGENEREVARDIRRHLSLLGKGDAADFEVVFYPPSFKVIPDQFPTLANALEILLMERRFPAVLGDLENENLTCNREIIASTPGINSLKGSLRGQPGILVSAGPSLDGLQPFLKWLSHQTLLTSVDTSFSLLIRQGLSPRFVFSLDPQEESFRHFAGHLDGPATLVYTPTANARILHGYKGKKVVVFKDGHRLYRDQEALAREKGVTSSGGSVSCFGLDCLIQLGCNPIFLLGQDCAFSGDRTHSRHAGLNDRLLERVGRDKTLSVSHQEKTREKKPVSVPGVDGTEILTNQSMYSYLRTIEQIALVNSGTKIYNLCSHGARIENVIALGSITEMIHILKSPNPTPCSR